jgi:pimeloyl-ACP methyl ester carboxylesterase
MKYFNGFSLCNEETLFSEYLVKGDLVVSGFSYGAQKAFEYVSHTQKRVDRLILLSPAFFQNQKASFIRTQLRYFEAGREAYVKQFLLNAASPSSLDLASFLSEGSKEELEALLTYRWDAEKIKQVIGRGTVIEVFLGGKDKIIDAEKAFEFFAPLTTTYFIKNAGHILRQ